MLTALLLAALAAQAPGPTVTVGSKAFPESWILGETLAEEWRAAGLATAHRMNLGGTEIVYQALRSGAIDVYPEYTGTIQEVILHAQGPVSPEAMRDALRREGIGMSGPIGFNDGYALAMLGARADRSGVRTLSDLARQPELTLGLSHEFLGRSDGFPGLRRRYALSSSRVFGIQHELAYGALASGQIDVTDIYTTDAEIERLRLRVLEDDRGFFPRYDAVWLYRLDLGQRAPRAAQAIERLTGVIDEARMIRANARVVIGHRSARESADSLRAEIFGGRSRGPAEGTLWQSIARNTGQHLKIVAISLLAAVLVGVPLGIAAARSAILGNAILAGTGLLQTVPSLALLAVLIPLFGIGVVPALIALFLYSLLPIVRNTYVGLTTLSHPLEEASRALGLSPRARLFRVRLPLASPAIMAGVKTSAVINVGTATLAALIGGGGLGEPILAGIQLRHAGLILQGAIPAALLALLVQRGFDLLDRLAIPKGLRLPAARG